MKRENLHQPFEISFSEFDESMLKEHDHTFFELVYILSGTGIQWINNNKFSYHDGHLFMITPGDSHSFEIHSTTKFINIKFNDIYIHSAVFGTENIKRLEFILQHANHQPGCILRNRTDKLLVKPMIEAIIREYVNRNLYSKEIITQLINTIIIVVARNIAMNAPKRNHSVYCNISRPTFINPRKSKRKLSVNISAFQRIIWDVTLKNTQTKQCNSTY